MQFVFNFDLVTLKFTVQDRVTTSARKLEILGNGPFFWPQCRKNWEMLFMCNVLEKLEKCFHLSKNNYFSILFIFLRTDQTIIINRIRFLGPKVAFQLWVGTMIWYMNDINSPSVYYVYVYVYIHIYIYIHTYIHTYTYQGATRGGLPCPKIHRHIFCQLLYAHRRPRLGCYKMYS